VFKKVRGMEDGRKREWELERGWEIEYGKREWEGG
jgi:hypothetical protein